MQCSTKQLCRLNSSSSLSCQTPVGNWIDSIICNRTSHLVSFSRHGVLPLSLQLFLPAKFSKNQKKQQYYRWRLYWQQKLNLENMSPIQIFVYLVFLSKWKMLSANCSRTSVVFYEVMWCEQCSSNSWTTKPFILFVKPVLVLQGLMDFSLATVAIKT